MADCSCSNFPASLGNVTFGAKVGIGTASPDAALNVVDNAVENALDVHQNSASGYGAYIFVGHQSASLDALNVQGWNGTAVVPGLDVKGNGQVGVGTTSPDAKFNVVDNASEYAVDVHQNAATGYGAYIFVAHQSPTLDALNVQGWNGTAVIPGLDVKGNGQVGVGTTSPAYPLDVNGSAHCSALVCGSITVADSGGCYYAS